jgi:hypothetical protein
VAFLDFLYWGDFFCKLKRGSHNFFFLNSKEVVTNFATDFLMDQHR